MTVNTLLTTFLSLLVCLSTGVVITPPNGDCWDSTLSILTAEVDAIFNATLASLQRTYTVCSIEIEIGIINGTEGFPFVAGGDYPLMVFLPNLNIECAVAGTCTLSGGQQHLFTVAEPTLLEAFLAEQDLELPEGFELDSSNLLVEGMTFTQGSELTDAFPPVSVLFSGPGENMVMMSCRWTDNRSEEFLELLRSAVAIERPENATVPDGFDFYSSLILLNSVFDNNRFWYSVVESFDENGGADVDPVMKLDVLGGAISNNAISTPVGAELSSMMSVGDVVGLVQNLRVFANTMAAAPSAIAVLDGDLEFMDMTFANNVIEMNLTECENISINSSDGNDTVLDMCIEDTNPGVPTEPTTSPPSVSLVPSAVDGPDTEAPVTEAPAITGPDTEAPATAAPVTTGPDTEAPVTEAPVITGPDTEAPATAAPVTTGPDTDAPATAAPATSGPDTEAPATAAPATSGPDTDAPATAAPATSGPNTQSPASDAPATFAPADAAPVSSAPASIAPVTDSPVSIAPASSAPATSAPISEAPVATAPVTSAPASAAPATTSPVTSGPVSLAPATGAPTTPTQDSLAPATAAPATTVTSAPISAPPVDGSPISPAPATPAPAPVTPAPTTLSPVTAAPVGTRPSQSGVPSNVPTDLPVAQPTTSPVETPTFSPAARPVITFPPANRVVVFPTFQPAPTAAPLPTFQPPQSQTFRPASSAPSEEGGMGMGMMTKSEKEDKGMGMETRKQKKEKTTDDRLVIGTRTGMQMTVKLSKRQKAQDEAAPLRANIGVRGGRAGRTGREPR